MKVKRQALPPSLQSALRSVGFHGHDIGVFARETFYAQDMGGEGRRAFLCIVDMENGDRELTFGSWGGPGIGSTGNIVDNDSTPRPLPPNVAVIQGSEGGNRPTFATISVHPSTLAPLLPAPSSVSEEDKRALKAINGHISSYRKTAWSEADLPGSYSPENSLVVSLAVRGFLKITKAGAISVTTEGKNAL